MSDIGLYYPLDPTQLNAFETIATDVLPQLRTDRRQDGEPGAEGRDGR
jgi:hypothetical protein